MNIALVNETIQSCRWLRCNEIWNLKNMMLYDYFRSSAAYRVRIALNLKGVDAQRIFVHLRRGEQSNLAYLEVNPQGLVPALALDGGSVLTQSLAIIEYLDETLHEPPLLPKQPVDRAWVRSLALAVACDIHPVDNLRVLNYLRDDLGVDVVARNRWYAHWMAKGLGSLEAVLTRDSRPGRFCFGDDPTLADVCLVPQIANAERMDCPLDDYPTLRRITAACRAMPAFQAAEPGRQPDAE
jgi:maleylpyruvate isomerase